MDYGYFHYDEPYARPRRRVNYFGWTLAMLLLTGAALAAWLLSFYIFGQPERPDSYRWLTRLHKIEQPKRFELTAAPAGEFLNPKQLQERYAALGTAALAKTNAQLARNYIRNFQQVPGLVPYVIGRYVIEEARDLTSQDTFTSGMVALTTPVENGEILMEHIYPADPQAMPLMQQTLTPGLEIKLERSHDLSAVIHVERLNDGRLLITAVPLLYGTYTVTRGPGTFSLEPPLNLNLEGGWPIFKEQQRLRAEMRYADFRRGAAPEAPLAIPGLPPAGTPAPAQHSLVGVEAAQPVETPAPAKPTPAPSAVAKATPTPKHGKLAKNQKPTPAPSAAAVQPPPVVAQQTAAVSAPPVSTPVPVVAPPPAQTAPAAVAVASAPSGEPVYQGGNVPPAPAATTLNPTGALASTMLAARKLEDLCSGQDAVRTADRD